MAASPAPPPLVIAGTFRLNKLADELYAAIPAWRTVGADGQFVARATLQYDGTRLRIDRPDTTQDATAQSVCAAHNPATPSAGEQAAAADRADLAAFPTPQQVQAALTALDADLTTLGGPVTVAALAPILRRTVQNQRALVRALDVLVRRAEG
jgi:hypothetical protein